MNALIVLLFLLIIIAELPGMLHRRHVREIVLFAALWAVGLTLTLIISNGGDTDQITKLLRGIFEPIGKLVIVPPPP